MSTFIQLVGAGLVLLAFALGQRGAVKPDSYPSLWLNVLGAGILAVLAFDGAEWGFFALEAIWATVAAAGLLARHRRARAARRHAEVHGPDGATTGLPRERVEADRS